MSKAMTIRCDTCSHREVCKFRPPEEYPGFMKDVISQNCTFFEKEEQETVEKNREYSDFA